jgi:alkanesulfonate monooxygenase SsuD/methylene tetrahydromethanopterin reductase-like flavin-dependent oxidoreductase (luciferase family)
VVEFQRSRGGTRDSATSEDGAVCWPNHVGRGRVVPMQIGVGIDASVGLSFVEEDELVVEAAGLGYTSAWTPSGPASHDGLQTCGRWASVTDGLDPSFGLGVAVIPAPTWTAPTLVNQAGTVGAMSEGRFVLGLGAGGAYTSDFRSAYGLSDAPIVGVMRQYVTSVKALLAGETVTSTGAVNLNGLRVTGKPLAVPVYISALGPQMLRLAGELADGVCLNWTTPDHRNWCRERIAEGAERAGRDPAEVTLMEFIRVCVHDDAEVARRTFAMSFMGYALSRPETSTDLGYRGHLKRMGFDEPLSELEAQRDAGATREALADGFPDELLDAMGYYGPAAGAGPRLGVLSGGLDVAVVRLVSAGGGAPSARAAVDACRPDRWTDDG